MFGRVDARALCGWIGKRWAWGMSRGRDWEEKTEPVLCSRTRSDQTKTMEQQQRGGVKSVAHDYFAFAQSPVIGWSDAMCSIYSRSIDGSDDAPLVLTILH